MVNQSQFQAIVETAVNGIIAINEKGIVVLFNPASEKLFGWSSSEVVGKNVSMLMPQHFAEAHDGFIHNYMTSRDPKIIGIGRKVLGLKKDGTEFPFHLSVGEYEEEGQAYFVGIVKDLSDEVAEKERLRAIIETAVDGIIVINQDRKIELFNSACERMYGWTRDEVIGQDVKVLVPEWRFEEFDQRLEEFQAQPYQQVLRTGEEVVGKRKDGSEFHLYTSSGSYEVGGQRYFVGVVRDMTDHKHEEIRLRKLENQLNVLSQHSAVSEMGAALAHELNQPLTAIDLFIVAAERSLDTDREKALALYKRVREEAARAGQVIRRIRQMVERSDGERTFFQLRPVIEGAVELCRLVDHDQGRSIYLQDVPDVQIFGDETQIRQIIVNLVKNSIDALDAQADKRIDVTVVVEDMVRINVIDNGPGVPDEFIPSLFDTFATTKEAGLGIGLSICQTIAESHGGRLTYRPRADGLPGAHFRLALPFDAPAE